MHGTWCGRTCGFRRKSALWRGCALHRPPDEERPTKAGRDLICSALTGIEVLDTTRAIGNSWMHFNIPAHERLCMVELCERWCGCSWNQLAGGLLLRLDANSGRNEDEQCAYKLVLMRREVLSAVVLGTLSPSRYRTNEHLQRHRFCCLRSPIRNPRLAWHLP